MLARAAFLALALVLVGSGCKKEGEARPPEPGATKEPAAKEGEAPAAAEEESPYLDVANFNRVVEEHIGEVEACYKETVGAGGAAGRVKVTIVVDGDGRVKKTTFDAQRSTLKDDKLNACIEGKAKEWRFNITLTGGESPMPYTFSLGG